MSESIMSIWARIEKDLKELKRQVLGIEEPKEQEFEECPRCEKEHDDAMSCLEAGAVRLNV